MVQHHRLVGGALLGTTAVLLPIALVFGPGIVAGMLNPRPTLPGYEPTRAAVLLHETLTVSDMHTDALLWDRRLTRRSDAGHADLPRLADGRVGIQGFTTVTKTPRGMNLVENSDDSDQITLLALLQAWPPGTWRSPFERARFQATKLRRAAEDSPAMLRLVESRVQLDQLLEERARGARSVGAILGLEGGHALEGDLANLDRLFEIGFRMIGLTHFFDNELGGSAHGQAKGGLTTFGRSVLAHAAERGMVIDLAHASPQLISDVMALARVPVVVSHTGVRGTCDTIRNLDDAQLRGIARTGGVVGIGLWTQALCGATPADWARAVRHAVSVAGIDHVGLGSDWDGAVEVIIDASGTVYLTDALLREGFEPASIRKVMGENVIRVLRATLPPS